MSKKIDTLTPEQELEQVKRLNEGFVDPDETPEPPKDPKPADPIDPPKDPEPKVDPPKDPPKDPEPPKDPPKDPTPPVDPPKEPVVPPVARQRPESYIPMAKYHSEKEEWKAKEETLNNQILELQTAAKDTKKDSPQEDEEIKAIADKHGYEIEAVRDMVNLARKGIQIPKEKLQVLDQANALVAKQAEQEYFDTKEWPLVEPTIKTQFPDATPEQLGEAKALLDKISHTPKYAKYDLDYILYKEKAQFDGILVKADKKPTDPPGQRTMDAARQPGAGGPQKLTVADFKTDKDFEKLEGLDPAEKERVVSSLLAYPLLYDRYIKYETYRDDQGVEINRDGRKIVLK